MNHDRRHQGTTNHGGDIEAVSPRDRTNQSEPRPGPTDLTVLRLIPTRRAGFVCGARLPGHVRALFWDNLGHFYYAWTTDENYSHGFLVPLISLYFANQVARARARARSAAAPWLGSSAAGRRARWCGW